MSVPFPRLLFAVPLSVFLAAGFLAASHGLINPHIQPEPCDSCHVRVPTTEEAAAGDYFLLKESIDETCHVCHEKTCCKPGSLHGVSHPSNINNWDTKLFRRPQTLPLYDGFITCSTCHMHSKPAGDSYKLVRLVKIDGQKIDWTGLCGDCHVGY